MYYILLKKGLIDQQCKGECDICSRTAEKNNVKLVAYLSTNGEPNIQALDRLIAGFEAQFGESELDSNLWKVWLFFFTYALLTVVYVSHVMRIDFF
jgi:hypothetical protein